MQSGKFLALLLFFGLMSVNVFAVQYSSFEEARETNGQEKVLALKNGNLNFWLFVPEGFGQTEESWPLLLYLHGASHRGNNLSRMKSNVPVEHMRQDGKLPFVVAAPQCPQNQRWSPDELGELIDTLIQELYIDVDRVYVTGMSLGAFGTWELAAAYPEKLAAIAPVSGGGKDEFAPKIKDLAIWAFHGKFDRIVSVGRSRNMVAAVRSQGGDAKLTEYRARHDIWTRVFCNSEIYEWLLQQKRAYSSTITYRNELAEPQLKELLLELEEERKE